MHTRTALTAVLLVLAAATTGCSSDSTDDQPSKPTTASVTSTTPTASQAEARQGCIDAWAEVISNRPADFDPDTDSDPEPKACKGLPEDEWTDRYMEGLTQSNQHGRDELDACLEDPDCTSLPID